MATSEADQPRAFGGPVPSGAGAHAEYPPYSPGSYDPVYGQQAPYPPQSPYPQQGYGSGSSYPPPPFVPVVPRFYFDVTLTPGQLEQCRAAVDRVLERELGPLATKLAVANERLFDQYDRLSAEASLRLNASVPLAVLFGILTLRLSWLFLLGVPAAVLLAWQGLGRMRAANDLLVQSVVTKTVPSAEVSGIARYLIQLQHEQPPT